MSFNNQHTKSNHHDGAAHHPKRDPCKSAVIVRLAGIVCIVTIQQKSKVGEMISLTAKQILRYGAVNGCVSAFVSNIGEALVLTSPFVFLLVEIAQTQPLPRLRVV